MAVSTFLTRVMLKKETQLTLLSTHTGNHELLETTLARPEVLPSRRGSTSEAAEGFHQRLLRGKIKT